MQSSTPEIPAGAWFKSSYSGANTSECVEVAVVVGDLAVRDSKVPSGPRLALGPFAWGDFVDALRAGRLG
ncbi:DUF397 domain-containing protein [Streptomyces sp. NPDC048479]|uniref:DUF397 domain-containing protein n=1 Tax=Streptomyces sp. NPDC048479 TaxID=3154725 RepID=UPI003430C48A